MASLQADARTFFSGDSSAGPGVYGSSGYMQSLEQQVGASRSTNRKQEAKLKKLEEELHNCRDRLSRSMVISDGNAMVSVGTTTERKLDRTQREVRSTELKRQKLEKGYESRMRVLESTVGDLMVQLELVQKDLSFAEKENAELKEDSESAAWDRRHTEKERQDMEAQRREVAELPIRIEEMKQDRDGLQAELKKGAAATKARVSKIESEISGLRSKLKQAEGLKEREKELDRDVKELNEARRASLMHKSKEKALEDRLVPEEIEARALKKKVAQVMMTVRATLRPWALLVLCRRGSVLTVLRLGLMGQISAV